MNKEFEVILNKIEAVLKTSLPESSNPQWKTDSFGKLPESINNTHIQNLISPNYSLISLGGKRWRPLFLILCYKMALKLSQKETLSEEQVYSITPLVEFVHTASLIHDDIEDSADLRRGKPAAHITYGLDTALNAGAWLYFEAPVCINRLSVTPELKLALYQIYSEELRCLHLGQAMDIFWHRTPSVFPTKDEYLAMVKNKTGRLASLAAKIGCTAGGLTLEEAVRFGEIASNIGIGFQIIDDVINLTTGNVGKKRGDDIVEGKKSLPVLMHVETNPEDKSVIAKLMEQASKEGIDSPAVEECISVLQKSGCIEKAAKEGTRLIKENCTLFYSSEIENLFISMIPENFR